VEINTFIDREALQRSTSVYFTEGVVHMLPEALSANLCSLKPNEDRLAVSAIMKMDKDFNIIETDILTTVINSKARFTYQDVQDIVEGKVDHKFKDDILILKRLAKRLFENRSDAGSIDFDIPEPIFEMGEKGIPHEIRPSERMESHRIVEECMLLANRVVAAEIPKKLPKKYPFVYRVHADPDQKDVVRFTDLLKVLRLGIQIPKGELSPNDIKNILKHVEDSPYHSLIENVALRTMSKAEYSMKNQGHFGLAFDSYTHFTSPIRRYPDLMVHRMIKMVCNQSIQQHGEWKDLMLKSIKISNEVELKALSAEREYIKMKQLRWLNERIGDTFEGRISGVVNFGIFIELQSSLAEGLIHIDTMEDDDYAYDEDRYCLRGRKTGHEYSMGDKVFLLCFLRNNGLISYLKISRTKTLKRFGIILTILSLWVGCDEAEEAIEEELCVTESQALTAASEALDGTTEAFENMCTAYGDAITCLSNAGEDVSELQEGYDELCGE